MRRKKHLDRAGGGGGGGTELFICFTSRPSASGLRPSASSKAFSPGRTAAGAGGASGAGSGGAADAAPAALLRPSLSRRLRNSGSLKGGQSPMFPPGTASGGRRGRGGMEPAEPSSPKVTCIGQVRVKGGKRKPKHASSSAAAALRSRSRRGGGLSGSEASFRRGADDRDAALHPGAKNQGWVYQIPVNICEALKTFGSCGGRSLCSPSRERGGGAPRSGAAGDKKRRRAPAGGSWLCGAAVARCLLAIQEEEDDVGKGSAVGPADEARESQVGLVMQGWDVEDDYEEEDETRVVVGEVEVEKEDEILLVGGKEEEGRVSVCIPPRNALLLMRCRSDPVRMAELATRFWGSPAAATASVGQVDNEGGVGGVQEEEKEEGHANLEKECEEEARNSAVSADGEVCRERGVVEDDGGEAGDAGQPESEDESSKRGDIGEEENDGGSRGDAEEKDEPVEAQIVRKDVGLEVEAAKSESQAPAMVEAVADTKEDADAPRMEEEVKGRRSVSSCSPSTALKEDRKLRRLGSTRRRVSTSSRASSSSDRVDRRHSFSAEMEARRSSFSSLKDSRRASFSIDRDGRRWSFTIEQEHLVAEPKVLMASRKGKKNSSEAESEKDCPVLVAAPNSVEEAQECNEDGKEEATNDDAEEDGTTARCGEINTEAEKVETGVDEEKTVEVKQEQRKKSGELPDCLLMMMCEPKLSMEVSKETWVCSTDFVHWKSHQGQNRRQQKAAATGSNAAASEETKDDLSNAPDDTGVAKDTEESTVVQAPANPASMPPQAAPKPPLKPAVEQKLKLELPKVAASVVAYAPLVLKRCKSEPLRSSARLAPDTCFWKEDRHRPLNATGIGF
ncbi:unnamed protein product [Triticum turgidum subsp. durum]|uniref:Uncharacterized protein n=1 Tax=Triticum turgidum subsp. durum TaxID=4567 RepID=A0A9R0V2S6_TRITD|nr:unnamed protein product [Triticum turgidum subsp. durum]